jgi:phosphoesterase RecJ-like protein
MGILTDTGGFQHRNVVEDTLKIAGELVSLGADITDISYRMFTNQSKERAKLHGRAMSNIKYFLDDRLAIITMFKKDFLETGAKREDTEGFIDFVMGIDTVKVGIALTEMDNGSFKASMRSKGPNVSAIAGVYGGGGHVLASGCQIFGDYYEVVDKLVYTVSQYMED